MTIKGNNMVRGKQANKRAVLSLLLYEGGLSRKQLSAKLELTPSAITVLVNEMIGEKVLKEVKVMFNDNAAGRKEIMLDIDERYYYALGIGVNLDKIIVSSTTIKGSLLWKEEIDFPEAISAQEFVVLSSKILRSQIETRKLNLDLSIGLGISVRGWIDSNEGICFHSRGLWEEKNVNLKQMFAKEIPLFKGKITVENNVRALANAQMLLSENDSKASMLFIRSELGIGGAMIVSKELYTGNTFHAIEIGHITVENGGELCRCGRQGCLETIASNLSIERHAAGIFSQENTPVLFRLTNGKEPKLSQILDSAALGEKPIQVYLDRALLKFANVIRMTFDVIDPQSVVLYGQAFENDYYYQTLKKAIFCDDSFYHIEKNTRKSEFNLQLEQKSAPLISVKDFFENGFLKII